MSAQRQQSQNNQNQPQTPQNEKQNGQQQQQQQDNQDESGSGSETDDPLNKLVEEPVLDKQGQVQQRTVEQNKKQDELVARNKRLQGLESNRSRSASRRDRRRRIQKQQTDGKFMHTNSQTALEEADANGELHKMSPFERIGPDSTSMDGPVTMARAERGEIPMRGSNPAQPYYAKPKEREKTELDDADGMKLSLEANLDIEIELKASIRGDITLALFA